jgi:hypothetical protein
MGRTITVNDERLRQAKDALSRASSLPSAANIMGVGIKSLMVLIAHSEELQDLAKQYLPSEVVKNETGRKILPEADKLTAEKSLIRVLASLSNTVKTLCELANSIMILADSLNVGTKKEANP